MGLLSLEVAQGQREEADICLSKLETRDQKGCMHVNHLIRLDLPISNIEQPQYCFSYLYYRTEEEVWLERLKSKDYFLLKNTDYF